MLYYGENELIYVNARMRERHENVPTLRGLHSHLGRLERQVEALTEAVGRIVAISHNSLGSLDDLDEDNGSSGASLSRAFDSTATLEIEDAVDSASLASASSPTKRFLRAKRDSQVSAISSTLGRISEEEHNNV